MRDHSSHIELNREEAIRTLLDVCRFSPEHEIVPIEKAVGRVLAEDVFAQLDMPNCLTCKMDSVAVHWSDFENGMPDTTGWVKGVNWDFANTGVGMPEGFDTAITVEHVLLSDSDTRIAFDALPSGKFAGTVPRGNNMKKGDLLVAAGTVVTPLLAAHILSGNNTEISVIKKPRVTFIPTGNELVKAPGKATASSVENPVSRGKNIETNSVMISGKIRAWGGEPFCHEILPDDPTAIEKALRDAVTCSDIIVLNAGTSKGSDDWSIEVVEKIGTVYYHQTTHGPGHHSWCAVIDGVPVIGISGPPGGASFTTDFYVYPAVMKYLGQTERLPRLRVRLGADLPEKRIQPKDAAPAGESTPFKEGEFYSVRLLKLSLSDDGVLEAFPFECRHWPAPAEAETGAAYYLMRTGFDVESPKKGNWIEVELRPDFLP